MSTKTVASDVKLDLSHEVCPYTLIRTKLALDDMEAGQVLEVALRGVAIENVSHSIEEEGHSIIDHIIDGETWTFFIKKNEVEKKGHACAQRDCLYCRDTLRDSALSRKKAGNVKCRDMIEALEAHSERLETATTEEVLRWALDYFGDHIALATSFGAEDMVLTDMVVKLHPGPRIFTLDTGRLHQETYDVMARTMKKYGVKIETFSPDSRELEELTRSYGPNLFYESIDNRISCCQVRKINPLKRALSTLNAWVCGLRKEQAATRTQIRKLEISGDNGSVMAKVNPLADWTEKQVWDYIRQNDVPYNTLHEQGFPSIGCAPCTRAIKCGEDIRAGRWWWELPEHKECGLHKKVK